MLSLLAGHTHSNRSRGGVCDRDSTSSIEIDLRAEEKQREEEEPGGGKEGGGSRNQRQRRWRHLAAGRYPPFEKGIGNARGKWQINEKVNQKINKGRRKSTQLTF